MIPSQASMLALCAVAGTLLAPSSIASATLRMRVRARVRAEPVGDDGLLAQQPSAFDDVAAHTRARDREGRARAVELAERQSHVAERLGGEHHGLGSRAPPPRSGRDRAVEYGRRIDVRIDRACRHEPAIRP